MRSLEHDDEVDADDEIHFITDHAYPCPDLRSSHGLSYDSGGLCRLVSRSSQRCHPVWKALLIFVLGRC
jgi:hypothetical protein